MTIEQLQSILGVEATAEVDENGQVVMTQQLTDQIAEAFANMSQRAEQATTAATQATAEAAQLKTTLQEQEQTIKELSESPHDLPKGAAETDNTERNPTIIEGSILKGMPAQRNNQLHISQRLAKVEAFAKEMGLVQ